jgi:hypothetical protein
MKILIIIIAISLSIFAKEEQNTQNERNVTNRYTRANGAVYVQYEGSDK